MTIKREKNGTSGTKRNDKKKKREMVIVLLRI